MYCDNTEQFILCFGTSSIPAMLTLHCLSLPPKQRAGNVCLNSFNQNERPGGRRLYSFLKYCNARATELQGYRNRRALYSPLRFIPCVFMFGFPGNIPQKVPLRTHWSFFAGEQRFYTLFLHGHGQFHNDVYSPIEYSMVMLRGKDLIITFLAYLDENC